MTRYIILPALSTCEIHLKLSDVKYTISLIEKRKYQEIYMKYLYFNRNIKLMRSSNYLTIVIMELFISGQEVIGGALPVGLVARGSHSRRRTGEHLSESCGEPRKTGWSGWLVRLDDPATDHENGHHHHNGITYIRPIYN